MVPHRVEVISFDCIEIIMFNDILPVVSVTSRASLAPETASTYKQKCVSNW